MTIQDLTNNRDRIIKKIKFQSNAADVKAVMIKMVAWIGSRKDISAMKPTMGNVDKFTKMATDSWLKNDWKPVMSKNEYQAFEEKRKMDSLPSSLR